MGLVSAWRRQLCEASGAALLVPGAIAGALAVLALAGGFGRLSAISQALSGPPAPTGASSTPGSSPQLVSLIRASGGVGGSVSSAAAGSVSGATVSGGAGAALGSVTSPAPRSSAPSSSQGSGGFTGGGGAGGSGGGGGTGSGSGGGSGPGGGQGATSSLVQTLGNTASGLSKPLPATIGSSTASQAVGSVPSTLQKAFPGGR